MNTAYEDKPYYIHDDIQAPNSLWWKFGSVKLPPLIYYLAEKFELGGRDGVRIYVSAWPRQSDGRITLKRGGNRITVSRDDAEAFLDEHFPKWCWYERPGKPPFKQEEPQ